MKDVATAKLPSLLIVASKQASLYPRQDDESEILEQLNKGEPLTPLLGTKGGTEWYMVKTRNGVVGWVKSADVREEKAGR